MSTLRPWLPYALTLVGSITFCLVQWSSGSLMSRPVRAAVSAENLPAAPPRSARVESLALAAARDTGIGRILSVLRRPDGKLIELEWESDAASTLRFIDELQRRRIVGDCRQLRMSVSSQASAPVRTQAVFALGSIPLPADSKALKPAVRKDLFESPRSPAPLSQPVRMPAASSKPADDAAMAAERLKQEEAARLAGKKQELESQLKLTGIVNNGREAVAFVSVGGAEGKNLMVHTGDTLLEARVAAIDDQKGELRLDYQGKLEVLLKLKPGQGDTR